MNRREFTKAVASIPIATSIVPTASAEEVEETEEEVGEEVEWNVRGVWKRRDDTGVLDVRDEDTGVEFDSYNNWVSTTLQKLGEASDKNHVVNLFDFRLISVYDGSYARSHFAHQEAGLEITIKHDPDAEESYTAVVTHIDEKWGDRREYSSNAQIAIAQKCREEREEYL